MYHERAQAVSKLFAAMNAIYAYKAIHPEVNWDTHEVVLKLLQGSYYASGHRARDFKLEAQLFACCAPGCPTHGS